MNNKVLFIGLSNKPNCLPLQSNTKSGEIIDLIISKVNAKCYKTNLVNFVPLNEQNKLRYPNKEEMDIGYIDLKKEIERINPDICILLGTKVFNYLSKKVTNSLKIKHPSYMYVYRRKDLPIYIEETSELINEKLNI